MRDRPRRRRDRLLRRRQPQRDDGDLAARATRASTSSTSTCTSPSPSRTAAAARGRGRSPSPTQLEPYLPRPVIVRRGGADGNGSSGEFDLDYERPRSIGRLRGFQGNYGCFVRAYAYICSLGAAGLRDASETAVLNANYLLARLRALGVTRAAAARLRPPLHARVRAQRRADAKRELGDPHARPRQAPARPRLPPADRVLPAARRGGDADRADRDRDARDARRVRAGDRRDPRARRARTPRSRAARRTRRRCGASTRPAPASDPRRCARRSSACPSAARRPRAR